MSSINTHALRSIARRSLDHVKVPTDAFVIQDTPASGDKLESWELAVLICTPIIYYLLYIAAHYTYFEVIPSLVMIEEPSTIILSEVSESNEPDYPLEKAPLMDEEVVVIQQEPITTNIRRTLKHLHSVGGYFARYRGFGASAAYHFMHMLVMHGLLVITGILPLAQPVMSFVCHMASTVILSRFHMVWTHIVISPPSNLPWYKREVRGGRHVFKALALPSLRMAVAHQLMIILPAVTFLSMGTVPQEAAALRADLVYRLSAVAATALVVLVFVLIPASTHLTRVEASLLPDDVDTIVPFDRTFGGRVFADTKFSVRYFAVLASADRAAGRRILKYYLKAAAIVGLVLVSAAVAIYVEVNAFGVDRIRATFLEAVTRLEQRPPQVSYVRI